MALVTVRITRLLADVAGADRNIEVEATTAAEALSAACDNVAALRVHVFDDSGAVRAHVNIFVRGEIARAGELDTALADGDEVAILQAVSGG